MAITVAHQGFQAFLMLKAFWDKLYLFVRMLMHMGRKKARVSLSIDSEVWARCQLLKAKAGANWSEVAEESFKKVLDVVDQLLALHAEGESLDSIGDDLLLFLQSTYHQAVADTYKVMGDLQTLQSELSSEPKE